MQPSNNNGSSEGTVTDTSVLESALTGAQNGLRGTASERTWQAAEQAFDKAVEEEAKDTKEVAKNESAEPKEELKEEVKSEEAETHEESTEESAEAEEGYFADEGLEDYEPESPVQQPARDNPLPANFSAEEQYIAQNIGAPINVRIKVGDQIQTVQAYSIDNLPDTFEFASEKDRTQAMLGFDSLLRKAENLQREFQQKQATKAAQDFSNQEDRDIQKDIAYLQRQKAAGREGLGLFKYAPNDPRFDNDPAVKEMQEVLDFYNQENQARFENSQRSGSQFRPLTYRDAFRLYRLENPVVTKEQQAEDNERKKVTRPVAKAGKNGGEAPKQQRPGLRRFATIDEITRAYGL